MKRKTIEELEKEIQAKGQLIMDKNSEISKQAREINEIKEVSQRFQGRCDTVERERDSLINTENIITKIINGKSKPLSKIEVLRDLINPRPIINPIGSCY